MTNLIPIPFNNPYPGGRDGELSELLELITENNIRMEGIRTLDMALLPSTSTAKPVYANTSYMCIGIFQHWYEGSDDSVLFRILASFRKNNMEYYSFHFVFSCQMVTA